MTRQASFGAKTSIASGTTLNRAGVRVTISPSALIERGRRVRISNSVARMTRTSSQAPCSHSERSGP